MFGTRPVASSTTSVVMSSGTGESGTRPEASSWSRTPSADTSACRICVPRCTRWWAEKARVKRSVTVASAAVSSPSPRTSTVTSTPRAENTWANSAAMNPPPTIVMVSGSALIRMTVSFVMTG